MLLKFHYFDYVTVNISAVGVRTDECYQSMRCPLTLLRRDLCCCVHDQLNCPVCMDDFDAFRLQHDRKVKFFDYH
jgi:hypothetical protein